ncbi:MAG TPA: CoA transferase, partial [Solirubrobacteraceae bacterium]|nr:CoA transferase [Solirubrobacteraceae bacterium]
MSDGDARHDGALAGLTVIDCSTLFAGPMAAMLLADYGAEVIKIEHPAGGDPARSHGHARDGVGLWFKTLGRGKRSVAADLRTADGAELLRRLCEGADVLIENFRPGTLERWGLGPERLRARNPGLVVARVTGFGQRGPLAHRPGFGTLAEAMSG